MAYKSKADHAAYMRAWYQRNKSKVRERGRQYEKEHQKEIRQRKKAYMKLPHVRTHVAALSLARYHAMPEYRKRQLIKTRERRIFWRKKIFDLLGGQHCCQCGFNDYRALQIDHKNGGGRKEFKSKPNLTKPNQYFTHIQKNIQDYQVLCSNCNWIKRFEKTEIPCPSLVI